MKSNLMPRNRCDKVNVMISRASETSEEEFGIDIPDGDAEQSAFCKPYSNQEELWDKIGGIELMIEVK